jgi:hypothetical protein
MSGFMYQSENADLATVLGAELATALCDEPPVARTCLRSAYVHTQDRKDRRRAKITTGADLLIWP